jgi:hypothetical protein
VWYFGFGFFIGDKGMVIPETNRKEITNQRLLDARKNLHDLQEWLGHVDEALGRALKEGGGNGFPILWASDTMQKSLSFYNEIARCNGAALVSAVSPSKKRRGVRR